PTYATGDNTLKYVRETRRVNGADVETVLLDSVASQANRMEEALLEAWERKEVSFPVIGVDFTGDEALRDLGKVTSLQAPHRIADAILRDAMSADGTLFRDTDAGRAYTDATPRNATAVFRYCPTALVFGVWDSTGPKGGLGAKFARVLTSEIVGVGFQSGAKVGSRLDPLGIQANVEIYHHKDDDSEWTLDEGEAKKDKGKPVPFNRKGGEGKGKPSAVNHSNIAPSKDEWAGGVTFDYAEQVVVLSLAGIRKLRFTAGYDGATLSADAARAAHGALAALGLAAVAYARAWGHDLRSRCLLVPEGELVLQAVLASGATEDYALSTSAASALLRMAAEAAGVAGLGWEREPIALAPAPKLVALVKKSRAEAAAGAVED
ncbi:MAG: type I-U CRISPR-associated RAMP protein Csb1/Cas7u, partial [Kofleriaceae bacterium]